MKIIIACAGLQSRWQNYMGIPKQMVPINNIPLLEKTIITINKLFPNDELYVSISNETKKSLYNVNGNYQFYIVPYSTLESNALHTLINLFTENNDDILVLLGDVHFSDVAYNIIKNTIDNNSEFLVFGRKYGNNITERSWGELFAYYIPNKIKGKLIDTINIVDKLYNDKLLQRNIGWEIISCYYSNNKKPDDIHKIFTNRDFPKESFIEINDETDDFDYPADYDNYIKYILNKLK